MPKKAFNVPLLPSLPALITAPFARVPLRRCLVPVSHREQGVDGVRLAGAGRPIDKDGGQGRLLGKRRAGRKQAPQHGRAARRFFRRARKHGLCLGVCACVRVCVRGSGRRVGLCLRVRRGEGRPRRQPRLFHCGDALAEGREGGRAGGGRGSGERERPKRREREREREREGKGRERERGEEERVRRRRSQRWAEKRGREESERGRLLQRSKKTSVSQRERERNSAKEKKKEEGRLNSSSNLASSSTSSASTSTSASASWPASTITSLSAL